MRGPRQRVMCIAAGSTLGVREACVADITSAAIVHLGQTVPERYLRCSPESRDMITVKTADGAFDVHNCCVPVPGTPGLGISPHLDVLGEPVINYR